MTEVKSETVLLTDSIAEELDSTADEVVSTAEDEDSTAEEVDSTMGVLPEYEVVRTEELADSTTEVLLAAKLEVVIPAELVVMAGGWVLEDETEAVAEAVDVVAVAVSQSKTMEGIAKSQSSFSGALGCSGKTMVTSVAPPHWWFLTMVPSLLQGERCLQLEPSGMV